MSKLSDNIKFQLLKKMNFEDLEKFCSEDENFVNFCSKNKDSIAKMFLNKYKVEYTDPTNYIYLANNAKMDDYKNSDGTWEFGLLLTLYAKSYSKKHISYTDGMTSFPIYPNMINFHGPDNDLKNFPVQPKMTECEISHNMNLKSFPVQPNMRIFSGEECGLTNFPIQPKMTHFYGDYNLFKTFPIQPEMKEFHGESTPLKSFPTQPKMKVFYARETPLTSMSFQPKIETCKANSKQCLIAFGEE